MDNSWLNISNKYYPDCQKENSKISIISKSDNYFASVVAEKTLFIQTEKGLLRFHPSIEKWSFISDKVSNDIDFDQVKKINVCPFQPFEEGHLFPKTIMEKAPWAFQTFLGVSQYGLISGSNIHYGNIDHIFKSISNGDLNEFFRKDLSLRSKLKDHKRYLSDHLFIFPVFNFDQLFHNHKQIIFVSLGQMCFNEHTICCIVSNFETRKSFVEFFNLPIYISNYRLAINKDILYFLCRSFDGESIKIGQFLSKIASVDLSTYTYTEHICSIDENDLDLINQIIGETGLDSIYIIDVSINVDIDKIRCILIIEDNRGDTTFYYCILDLLTMIWHLPWRRRMLSSLSFSKIYEKKHKQILISCPTSQKRDYLLWAIGADNVNNLENFHYRFVTDDEKKNGYLLATTVTEPETTVILKFDLESKELNLGKITIKKVLENLSSKEINNYQQLRDIGIPKRWIQIINDN